MAQRMGFDYFGGLQRDRPVDAFISSGDHMQIHPWVGHPGYNLTPDLADEAIKHMNVEE